MIRGIYGYNSIQCERRSTFGGSAIVVAIKYRSLLMKVFTNYFILLWLLISLIWCALVGILLPPVGAQVNHWVFVGYLLGGPVVVAIILVLLHSVDSDIFSSLQKASPIGLIFVAIFALFGYLITAERDSRGKFLEKQLDSCADIAETVGILASVGDDNSLWIQNKDKFWSYYWGRLGVFENSLLEGRMVQFGDLLWDTKRFNIRKPALCIAHTCKAQARESWSVVPGLIRADVQDDLSCQFLDEKFEEFCRTYNLDRDPPPHPECGAVRAKGKEAQ
jgi:hypothetical protein